MSVRASVSSWLLATLAALASGCATAATAVVGAALCGDARCREELVGAGMQADAEILTAAVTSGAEIDPGTDPGSTATARTSEEAGVPYEPPPTEGGTYFHCVDASGRHVMELVAPSELDARLLCAAERGVRWDEPEAATACTCTPRG